MKLDLLYALQGRCCHFTFMRINSLRSASKVLSYAIFFKIVFQAKSDRTAEYQAKWICHVVRNVCIFPIQ